MWLNIIESGFNEYSLGCSLFVTLFVNGLKSLGNAREMDGSSWKWQDMAGNDWKVVEFS